LKNDDAEDGDEDGDSGDDDEALLLLAKEAKLAGKNGRQVNMAAAAVERQPTGRVVGIIKRNWRA
jgi:exosome complex exonuclease DIS3/RRP44